jgi:hypothetical protein
MKLKIVGGVCLVCKNKRANIVVVPCNHLSICDSCYNHLKDKEPKEAKKCQTCKGPIDLKKSITITLKDENGPLGH